ncbi:unnamed protein product, partial [Symbiodinium microadriaticum]
ECVGYHHHPQTRLWYVHPTGSELAEDPITKGFLAFKKREITCHSPADDDEGDGQEEGEL